VCAKKRTSSGREERSIAVIAESLTVEERERFRKRKEILVEGLDDRAEEALICWSVPQGRVDQGTLVRKACALQVATEE